MGYPYPDPSSNPGAGSREPGAENREPQAPREPAASSELPFETPPESIPEPAAGNDGPARYLHGTLSTCAPLIDQIRRTVAPALWPACADEIETAIARKGQPNDPAAFASGVVKRWLEDRAQRQARTEPTHEALVADAPFRGRVNAVLEGRMAGIAQEHEREAEHARQVDAQIAALPEVDQDVLYAQAWVSLPPARRPLSRADRGAAMQRAAREVYEAREQVEQ